MNLNFDLKNIDLKNITLEDIQAKLKNVEKKTWIKLGVSAGAVVFFLIIFYGVLNPIVNKKKAQLDDMNLKIEETNKFINDINVAKAKIKKIKPRYEQYSTLFHTRAEVEGLYQTLSQYAGANNLIISKIEKRDIQQVTKAAAMAKAAGKKAKTNKMQCMYIYILRERNGYTHNVMQVSLSLFLFLSLFFKTRKSVTSRGDKS